MSRKMKAVIAATIISTIPFLVNAILFFRILNVLFLGWLISFVVLYSIAWVAQYIKK